MTSKEIRVLLIGKTGSGKSSVGNQLIGSKVFKVGRNYGTKQSQLERRTLEDGSELVIVDTPGYCNIHLTEDETQTEINRGMELLAPGPHSIIMVFSLSERVTGDDIKRLENFQSLFDMYLQKHILVVFTGMDELEDQTLDEYIEALPQQFKDFLNRLETSPIGVAARNHTDINSSSQIIQAVQLTYEKLGHSFIETSTIRKRKCDDGWISVEESKVARKDNAPFNKKRTVLLLGKSGIGKSSLGNVLLGEKRFAASMMEEKGTKTCQIEESDQLLVVDTPGFFSSLRSDVDTAKDIITTIQRLTSIHVFILVLSVDDRFSGSEDKAWDFVRSLLGGEIQDLLMYVFTGKDFLEDDDRQFIFPHNLPSQPYHILNCKRCIEKDRSDLLQDIVSSKFNKPISITRINNAQLDLIEKTEKCRKEASKMDGEALRRAVYSRLGHDEPRGYVEGCKIKSKDNVPCIEKTEIRRKEESKVDGEAFRRAGNSRLGHDEPRGYFQRIRDCVNYVIGLFRRINR